MYTMGEATEQGTDLLPALPLKPISTSTTLALVKLRTLFMLRPRHSNGDIHSFQLC